MKTASPDGVNRRVPHRGVDGRAGFPSESNQAASIVAAAPPLCHMKVLHFLPAALLGLAGCAMPVRVNDVLPATAAVATINVVLPGSKPIRVTGKKDVAGVVNFLRSRRWTEWDGAEAGRQPVYRLVLGRADGNDDYVDVMRTEIVADGYSSLLSPAAERQLDLLCGLNPDYLAREQKLAPKPAS